jgi:hypothetical protein
MTTFFMNETELPASRHFSRIRGAALGTFERGGL